MKLQTLSSSMLQHFEPMLNESIYHFLSEFHNGRTDFSELSSIFFRLIQTMTDPPLEFIWFYSAITFQTAKSSTLTFPPNCLLSLKDLFHSLVSVRNPSSSGYSKQVALVAPVLYHLLNSKFEQTVKTEVEGLVDAILRHIIMCCNSNLLEQEQEVGVCKSTVGWVGLVPVWIADRVRQNEGPVDGFHLFFPLSTEEMRRGIHGDCGIDYLAAFVMVETFLFRLCLMFGYGGSEMELHKDVKSYAAQIIHGFKRNSSFLVMLFKLLLEPCLPVGELLAAPDELILRRLLYDVALDFSSFLSCDSSPDVKEIVVLWLFVTNTALHFASEHGDHDGVNCYLNAFSSSQLPRQIVSWVTGVTTMKPTAPDISSPKDIIGWLLILEQQGLKVCDHSISELHEKVLKYNSMVKVNGVKDGQTMVEDAPVRINGGRKRSSTGFWEVQKQIKVIKCYHENLGDDGFCGKTEVGNSVSDQEMVDMVR